MNTKDTLSAGSTKAAKRVAEELNELSEPEKAQFLVDVLQAIHPHVLSALMRSTGAASLNLEKVIESLAILPHSAATLRSTREYGID